MSNQSNSNEKIITIEAELPIPLVELFFYVLKQRGEEAVLLDFLYNKSEEVNRKVEKVVRKALYIRKSKVKVINLCFEYNDSDKFSHGASYFNVLLKGTEKELRKIAGEDNLFLFNWDSFPVKKSG